MTTKRKKSKQARLRLRKKQTKRTKKQPSSSIIGYGKDGCLFVDPQHPTRVFKWFKSGIQIDRSLQDKLRSMDPEETRYSLYSFPSFELQKPKQACETLMSSPLHEIVSMKRLDPLNTETMTRAQYRHLRKSIELLHEHGISHGDLIGNVMMDPTDHLPRIIDWEDAQMNTSNLGKEIDRNAFFSSGYFKLL